MFSCVSRGSCRDLAFPSETAPPTEETGAESALTHSSEDPQHRQPRANVDASSSHGDPEPSDVKESSPPSSGDNLSCDDTSAARNEEAKCGLELTVLSKADQTSDGSGTSGEQSGEAVENGSETVRFTIESEDEIARVHSDNSRLDIVNSTSFSEFQPASQPPKSSSENHLSLEPFDRQASNVSAESNDELLQIMGAVGPASEQSASKPSRSSSDSSETSQNSVSILLADPYFLHVRVQSSKSGFNHTYTPLNEKGIEIPQDRRSRSKSPRLQLVKSYFCFAVPERR